MMKLSEETLTEKQMDEEALREKMLINGPENLFGIYQLKDVKALRDYRFEPLNCLISRGLKVERRNYTLVYTGPLSIRDRLINLNKIFQTFNRNPPADFKGHSPSVSDVIVLQWRGKFLSAHYIDDLSFKELPDFWGNEVLKG